MQLDKNSGMFNLHLAKRAQKNFLVEFGGVLATRDVSNISLGINYYYFNRALTHAYVGFQTGSFYKSATLRTRIDLPVLNQFFIQPEVAFNGWDYPESADLLQKTSLTILKRFDRKVGFHVGKAAGNHFRGVISIEGFNNEDRYSNNTSFVSTDILDILHIRGYK